MSTKAVVEERRLDMDSDNATPRPETRVSFRLSAPGLDPDAITKDIGLTPDYTHREGDHPRGNPKYAAYKTGMWALDSKLPLEEPLESHVNALLSTLEPKQAYIRAWAEHAEADFYSTIFDMNGCQLSSQTLTRLANLGAGLSITVYSGNDEPKQTRS